MARDVLALSLPAWCLEIAVTVEELLCDQLLLSAESKGKKVAVQARFALLVSLLADLIAGSARPDCALKLVNYSHGSNWLINGVGGLVQNTLN